MLEVQSNSGPADIAALREKLGKLGLGAVQIQSFGAPSDVLIRVEEQPGGDAAQQVALKKVTDALAGQFTQRRVEVVGPAVSSELRMTGFIAVTVGPAGDRGLRLVPVRMAVRSRRDRGPHARRAAGRRHLLAVPARVRPVDRGGAADHPRLLRQRHRGGVRPHPREPAQVQAHGPRRAPEPVDQRDALAHHPHRRHRHRRADLALHLRRRGDPQLQPRHAARRRHRHLLVDLHRRAAAGLPRRQARMGGGSGEAGRRGSAARKARRENMAFK